MIFDLDLINSLFFTAWGVWNVYYYPALNQPLSFYGGLFVVVANAVYVWMMIFYRKCAKKTAATTNLVHPGAVL